MWSVPELTTIAAEVFESPCTAEATVSFDALGEFIVVSSGSSRLIWHADNREKLTSVGTYSGGSSLRISALAAGAPTLVVQERTIEESQCFDRFRWIDFTSPVFLEESLYDRNRLR